MEVLLKLVTSRYRAQPKHFKLLPEERCGEVKGPGQEEEGSQWGESGAGTRLHGEYRPKSEETRVGEDWRHEALQQQLQAAVCCSLVTSHHTTRLLLGVGLSPSRTSYAVHCTTLTESVVVPALRHSTHQRQRAVRKSLRLRFDAEVKALSGATYFRNSFEKRIGWGCKIYK